MPQPERAEQPGIPPGNITVDRIVVPIDFSDHSKNALTYAVPIARQFGAELILVYVVEATVYPHDFGFSHAAMARLEQELAGKGQRELEKLIETVVRGEVPARAIIRSGKPYLEIITAAEEENADLIIIATHGHTGVEHLLFGSTAEMVVRKAGCSVLIWRENRV